mmetsp:Transcript_21074/g.25371  ORF Transcript_21074/g.25371 Transcript_21074/m.25371 type:complete len:195 (+) Transcript_21074:62-646(+)
MTLSQIDAVDTLMAQYASGGLSAPASVLVEAHLEIKPDNRRFVGDLETIAGLSLEQVAPTELDKKSDALSAIFASSPDSVADVSDDTDEQGSAARLPLALRRLIGMDVEDIPWRTKLPGFKEYDSICSGSVPAVQCQHIRTKAVSYQSYLKVRLMMSAAALVRVISQLLMQVLTTDRLLRMIALVLALPYLMKV